jgi:hypothetical protein
MLIDYQRNVCMFSYPSKSEVILNDEIIREADPWLGHL